MFTFAELAVKRFKEGTPETKRGILLSLGWNLSIKDRKLDLSRESWIKPIREIAKRLQAELPTLEPVLAVENKVKIVNLLQDSVLCSLLYDVRTAFINNPDRTWFPIVDQWRREGLPHTY
jgi:hypothetical protein